MNNKEVLKDERTIAIENKSYRWAYFGLTFGLLLDVAYRGLIRNEASWDLLALVIITGFAATVFQATQKTMIRGWMFWAVGTALIASLAASVIVFLR